MHINFFLRVWFVCYFKGYIVDIGLSVFKEVWVDDLVGGGGSLVDEVLGNDAFICEVEHAKGPLGIASEEALGVVEAIFYSSSASVIARKEVELIEEGGSLFLNSSSCEVLGHLAN